MEDYQKSVNKYEVAERLCLQITQTILNVDCLLQDTLCKIHTLQFDGGFADPERAKAFDRTITEYRTAIAALMSQRIEHNVPKPDCRCKKPSRISANESEDWKFGTLCGVRFDDKVNEDTTRFVLRRTNKYGTWETLSYVALRENGEWYCGAFAGIHSLRFPHTIHANFKNLVDWVVKFHATRDGQPVDTDELCMVSDEPDRN